MLGPIPRHAALINANAAPSMGTIFTLAIRQSFGLSLPQASTPQIHPDSIIPFPVSAAIWDFIWEGVGGGCGGGLAGRELLRRIATAESTKVVFIFLFFF